MENQEVTTQQRWSFNCPQCKAFKVVDLVQRADGSLTHFRHVTKVNDLPAGVEVGTVVGGQFRPFPRQFQTLDTTPTTIAAERRCPCGGVADATVVTGTLKRESVCDSACTHAHGDDCECACGGQNHGIGWLGLGWRIVFRPDGSRKHARTDTAVEATPEVCKAALAVKAEKARERRERKAQAEREAIYEQRKIWSLENPGVEQYLADHYMDNPFLTSLQDQLDRWGNLSTRQADAVRRNMEREDRAAVETQPETAAPEGRVTVSGEVVKVKEQDGYMGGQEYKLIVKLDDGNRVWATCPNNLYRAVNPEACRRDEHWTVTLVGKRVKLTATFIRSDRDEHFSFGKRPVAEVIKES